MWTDARTDGRRLDYYTISSPCEPSAQVSQQNLLITPDAPKYESGLIQLIMMGKSNRQIWVNTPSYRTFIK